MSFARKLVVMAIVPLLAMGQSEPSEDDDEAPSGDSSPGEAFAPYQTIIDRLPFGPPPPNFDPDAQPGSAAAAGGAEEGDDEAERSEEEQQIVASVRVSVLNKTPSGVVVVGFTDSSVQPQKHYLLKVGEKRDMWEVKEADPTNQVVVLVKNGVEATLKVGEGSSEGKGGKAGKVAMPSRGRLPQRMAGGDGHIRGRQPSGLALLRDRRRKSLEDLKEEEERKEAAQAQARKDAAQQREALMQIQEELRRQREEREQHAAQAAQESPRQEDGGEQAPQE